VLAFFLFSIILFVSCHRAQQKRFSDLYVKRRGLAQGSAFWGFQRFHKLPRGSFSPKIPQNLAGNGMNNFLTVHAIFVQLSSIGAAWRKKFKNFNEIIKFRPRGHSFGKKRPQ
jgi:hypothetical protein